MEEKIGKKEKVRIVVDSIREQYLFVYVQSVETYYYKRLDSKIYEPITEHRFETIIRDHYVPKFGIFDASEIDNIKRVLKLSITEEIDDFDRSLIYISGETYWDARQAGLTRTPDRPCFYMLFRTRVGTKHVVVVAPFSDEQDQRMWEKYRGALYNLEKGNELPVEYDFVMTWADGNVDLYRDMMRAIAYMFLYKKPLGSYVLVGQARGGKSSYIGLIRTIAGVENSSMVQLTQLGDAHHTHELITTLVNAPDEEDDKAVAEQAFFKTMSDHGQLNLPVMRSNIPINLNCDFMSFFPMNHIPEWSGTGAEACVKRTLVLPFYANLSANDENTENFAENTYTADMLCGFMGTVFALATYYSSHKLEFSFVMRQEQSTLLKDVDSCVLFRKQWEKYFDGYQNDKILYIEYVNWCKENDVKINTLKELKFVFREYKNHATIKRLDDRRIHIYRMPKPGHHLFIEMEYLPEFKWTVQDFIDNNESCVQHIIDYYEERGVDLV